MHTAWSVGDGTRRVRRLGVVLVTAAAVAASPGAGPAAGAGERRISSLRKRPFVVVAVVDTGINPYHRDFRRPELTVHPSKYIEGFPRSAPALDLSFGARSLDAARAADVPEWEKVQSHELVWIPGTNIVGAIDASDRPEVFFDTSGHGTGVASLAGGSIHGPPTDDVLIVAVSDFTNGLEWAVRQPWIDIITNSWTTFDAEPVVEGAAEASRQAVAAGKVVCFASGNAHVPLWFTGEQGPSWNVNVGAASRRTRGEHVYTGWPNDVLGVADVTAAEHNSIDGERDFGGTSAAAPNVCGLIGTTLARVRARIGDNNNGPEDGTIAVGRRGRGYVEDGRLTNDELVDAIQVTAVPAEPSPPASEDPYAMPAAPVAPWIRGGYGIVDDKSVKDALALIIGDITRPERDVEDAWLDATDEIRDAIWGTPP